MSEKTGLPEGSGDSADFKIPGNPWAPDGLLEALPNTDSNSPDRRSRIPEENVTPQMAAHALGSLHELQGGRLVPKEK